MGARDGKGCLAELDEHDKLDARPNGLSTNPAAMSIAHVRAQCLMVSGQCDAGKTLFRKAYATSYGGQTSAEQTDQVTEATAGIWCTGKLGDRDEFIRARTELQNGAYISAKDVKVCMADYQIIMKLKEKVKPKDD